MKTIFEVIMFKGFLSYYWISDSHWWPSWPLSQPYYGPAQLLGGLLRTPRLAYIVASAHGTFRADFARAVTTGCGSQGRHNQLCVYVWPPNWWVDCHHYLFLLPWEIGLTLDLPFWRLYLPDWASPNAVVWHYQDPFSDLVNIVCFLYRYIYLFLVLY